MKKMVCLLSTLALLLLLGGCAAKDGLQDGYYTAEAREASRGWKEFVTITVRGGNIMAVEYNAKNASGFIKSWDNAYMHTMNSVVGTYPNEYTRNYAAKLLQSQSLEGFDSLSGATTSATLFSQLAQAVLDKAQTGDATIAIVG